MVIRTGWEFNSIHPRHTEDYEKKKKNLQSIVEGSFTDYRHLPSLHHLLLFIISFRLHFNRPSDSFDPPFREKKKFFLSSFRPKKIFFPFLFPLSSSRSRFLSPPSPLPTSLSSPPSHVPPPSLPHSSTTPPPVPPPPFLTTG